MHKLIASVIAAALLASAAVASAKGPVSGPGAKAHIAERLQYSSRVADKTKPFVTRLEGKKGDRVRPFTASNIRSITVPGRAPEGAQGGMRLTVGNRVTGSLNMKTGAVHTTSVISPR